MSEENDTKLQSRYPWLTQDLLKKIIEKDIENGPITIVEFVVKPALKHGENYVCQIIRVIIKYRSDIDRPELKETRFVIKALHSNQEMQQMTQEHNIFDREIEIYQKLLPKMEELLAAVGDNSKLGPRCFDASTEEMYIIFEDLTSRHYKNTDKQYGLDIDHYKKVLEKLAKFHAASAVILAKNYAKLEHFQQKFFQECSDDGRFFTDIILKSTSDVTRTMEGLEKITEKLDKVVDTLFISSCRNLRPDPNTLNVLNHGDLWVNNIMYKYDNLNESSPIDALIVDFQMCLVGPPALDLSLLMFTSSHEDMQDKEWDLIIQYYHSILKDTLIKLEYPEKIPTLTDIHEQFLRKSQGMISTGLIVQGMRQYEEADENTNQAFFQDTEEWRNVRRKMFANPKVEKSLRFLLDYFNRKGLLEEI